MEAVSAQFRQGLLNLKPHSPQKNLFKEKKKEPIELLISSCLANKQCRPHISKDFRMPQFMLEAEAK